MNRKIWLGSRVLSLILVTSVLLGVVRRSSAQATAEVPQTGPIPTDHYKTWSLFLVCNPEWLAPEKSSDLYELYQKFLRFGRAIGNDHVAVWFWKTSRRVEDPNLAANVDVEWAVRLCQALQLRPSLGPHVLVTNSYPNESLPPKDYAVFELGKMSPTEISQLLGKLTDELILTGRVGNEAASEGEGALWIRLLEVAQRAIGSFGCAWTLKLQTGFLTAAPFV